jgi:pyrroline-5-carboxylate reductase
MIKHLVLVGCGHMGYAMLKPWVAGHAASRISVVTPEPQSLHGLEKEGVACVASPSELKEAPDVIMFAVKPQVLGEVLQAYKGVAGGALLLSVAAGKQLSFYEGILGASIRLVRAMPNLAAKVGEGATLLVKNAHATQADSTIAETLLSVLGITAWLESEQQMDAATALSGCGPAYFYLLADVLAKAGTDLGLPAGLSVKLAKQTLLGSAALWREETASAETLYQNIAVKGGMTEAAIETYKKDDALLRLTKQALEAAVTRGKALSK